MDRSPGTSGSGAYDAVVIGSGLGGAFAAHALTEGGARVLVLERGRWAHRDLDDWNPRRILIESRYRGSSLRVRQGAGRDGSPEELPVNEVVGGKSVFYGAAALRFRPADFDGWPLSYEDLEPWYGEAERLLGVHGTAGADPVEPPRSGPYPYASPPLSAPAERIHAAGRRLGLRPFPLPLAINFTNDAAPRCVRCDTCDGFPCRIEAKNDAAGLLRAAEAGGRLTVAPGVAVRRLRVERGRITGVEGVVMAEGGAESREECWSAPLVVLAAGAIGTPAVLLRSGLDGPEGGRSVGRFLMRHCNAVTAGLFPFPTNPERVFHKQVCFTDDYEDRPDGFAGGVVQDIYTPAPEVVRHFAGGAARLLLPGPVVARLQSLICITEDEAQAENGVALTGETDELGMERVEVRHRYRESDRERLGRLTRRARRILRAAGALATRVWPIRSFSHAVGTVRMAASPAEGPLDPAGRFRGIDNLFVTDGSTFPSSAGVNPSLTIAANALRIASALPTGLSTTR